MANQNQQNSSVIVQKAYDGRTIKHGKVQTIDRGMSTYEKAMDAMKQGSGKEGGVKRKAKPVTKSNAKGTLGKKNSRKRN